MNREELEKKAKELGIKFTDETEDSDLEKEIKEAEIVAQKKKDDDDSKDIDHWKTEAKKAFEDRDGAKAERRKVQSKVTELEKKLEDAPNAAEFKALKVELDNMKTFKAEMDTLAEEASLKEKSDVEKAEVRFKKEMKTFQEKMEDSMSGYKKELDDTKKVIEDKDQEIVSLRKSRLKSEIIEFAAKYKAYNPSQIVKLIEDNFEYETDLDKFMSYEKDFKGKITGESTVEETVKGFLEDNQNDNLVMTDLKGKGLHTEDTKNIVKDKGKITKNSDGKYDINDDTIKEKADFAGLPVDAYIETLELKDAKLAKVQEKREQSRE